MSITTYAIHGTRLVRTVTLVLTFTVLVAVLALQAFQARYGQPTVQVVTQADTQDVPLSVALEQQAALGRTCSDVPSMTDTVLYQATGSDVIAIVTFDRALAESAAGTGWIRGYCVRART